MNRASEYPDSIGTNILNSIHMNKLILILLIITFLLGCEEKHKIQILKNYDIQYYSENKVSTPAIPKDSTLEGRLNNKIAEIIKSSSEKEGKKIPGLFPHWRLYINKYGNVDYIKNLGREYFKKPVSDNEITTVESIISQLLPDMAQWEFTPAILFGEYVNSYIDIKAGFAYLPDGSFKILSPIKFNRNGNKYADYFVSVEQMPEPIGGIKAIQENVVYPEIAKRAGVQGRVYVTAYLDSTGTVVKTKLMKGIGSGCDEAAMEAIKKVKFTPGRQRGKAVNVRVTVPIRYKLDNSVSVITKPKSQYKGEMVIKSTKDENLNGLAKVKGKIISQKDGMSLAGANIILVGTKIGCASDQNGEFLINKIPPGKYNLRLSHLSYGQHNMGSVELTSDKTVVVELKITKKK